MCGEDVVGQHLPVRQRQNLERTGAEEAQFSGQLFHFARIGANEYPGAGVGEQCFGERERARAAVQSAPAPMRLGCIGQRWVQQSAHAQLCPRHLYCTLRAIVSRLFEPWMMGQLALANRIIVAPMCQYSAEDGSASDWHMIHLGHLALSGAGLILTEATAVSPEGRISAQDLGLYSDQNEAALGRVIAAIRKYSPIAVAVQLAHAGRKASSLAPWDGGRQVPLSEPGGWKGGGPSAL